MIVCLCEGVSDRQVDRLVDSGCRTVRELSRACGAGAGCGTCVTELRRLLRERSGQAGAGVTAPRAEIAKAMAAK